MNLPVLWQVSTQARPRHCKGARAAARSLAVAAGLTGPIVLSACGAEPPDGRLEVAVTVPPLAEIVERVAPGLTDITVLIPPGASPVAYQPSMTSVRAAASADLYVSVGHPAFAWETTWLAGLVDGSETATISAAEGCSLIPDDPHVWLDLDCVRSTARRVAAAIQKARPESADLVTRSLTTFLATVDDLESTADRALSRHRGGSFLVLHPAWGYVAAAHDLQQISILEHGSGDAGPAELAAIVRRARRLDLRDVLVQPEFSAEPAMLVAAELGGSTVELDPLARDWASAYGRAIEVLAEHARP
jgi:zinc transport system substrate-binding protein